MADDTKLEAIAARVRQAEIDRLAHEAAHKVIGMFDRKPVQKIEPKVEVKGEPEPEVKEPEIEIDQNAVQVLEMAMDMTKKGRIKGAVVILGRCSLDSEPYLVTDAVTLMAFDVENDITTFMGGMELAKIDALGLYNDLAEEDYDED